MNNDPATARALAQDFRDTVSRIKNEVQRVIVGQDAVLDGVVAALFCDGHALLEGVPGLAKTLLVRTLAEALDLGFSRIQFTPDLMPADILGTMVLHERAGGGHELRFEEGPIVANFILADEINRATPKTQSALLEAMQERTITIARAVRPLPSPFIVLATQNPIEQEGTYPLPEAQIDRFLFKLLVRYPSESDYHAILTRTTGTEHQKASRVADGTKILELRSVLRQVPVPDQVRTWAIRLVMATQPDSPYAPEAVRSWVALGSSPRGAQALLLAGKYRALLAGRMSVACDDLRLVAHDVLRHRVLLNYRASSERRTPDEVVDAVLHAIPRVERFMSELFPPDFIDRIAHLRIAARRVAPGGRPAEHHARSSGSGVEFRDLRGYVAGDDPRSVDWNLYRRFGRLFLKLKDEHRDLPLHLLLDLSDSLWLEDPPRADAARRAAALLSHVSLHEGDPVTIHLFGAGLGESLGPVTAAANLGRVLGFLEAAGRQGPTDFAKSLGEFGTRRRRPSLVVVISDFFDPQGIERVTSALRLLSHRLLLVRVGRAADRDPGLAGELRLSDVETDSTLDVTVDAGVLRRYAEAFGAFERGLVDFARVRGAGLVTLDADSDLVPQFEGIFRGGVFTA